MINIKLSIFILHIVVGLFLGYLSFMIMNHKEISFFVGVAVLLTSFFVVIVHTYLYFAKTNNPSVNKKQRGLSFNPNNTDYDIIGGAGGLGWL